VQDPQPALRVVQGREQRFGDLLGGQHVVLGEPAEQDPVPFGEVTQSGERIRA
jgi:hypothetical protein